MSSPSADVVDAFFGPKLKVERAIEHINSLKEVASAYSQKTQVTFGPLTPARTRQVIFSQKPPAYLPCLIGDAVHNLRAALDILICDAVRMRSKPTKNVMFPFAIDAAHLEARLSKMKIDSIDPRLSDLMRAIKPFHSGNKALRDLHDLDVQDKHELLIPVFSKSFAVTDPSAYMAAGMRNMFNHLMKEEGASRGKMVGEMTAIVRSGMHYTQVHIDGALHISPVIGPDPHDITIRDGEMAAMATDQDPSTFLNPIPNRIDFYFPDADYPFSGQPVVCTLEHLTASVSEVIELFRATFTPD